MAAQDLEAALISPSSRPLMAHAHSKPRLLIAMSMVAAVACVASFTRAVVSKDFGLEVLFSFVLLVLATVLSTIGWARSLPSPTLIQVLAVWAREGAALVAGIGLPMLIVTTDESLFLDLFILEWGCLFVSGCFVFYDAIKNDAGKWLAVWNNA